MEKFINDNLLTYLKYVLNKDEIVLEDLSEVKEITFNTVNINNEYEELDLDILKYFSNLETVTFINLFIKNKHIKLLDKIKTLKNVTFENCEFEEELVIRILNINSLSFINTDIRDLTFVYNMKQLTSLTIINDNVKIKGINKLTNLKYLDLSSSLIEDKEIIYIKNLEHLYISNTNYEDLNFLLNMKNLKSISIDRKMYDRSKLLVKKLITDGIIVYDEGFIMYEVGENL